MFTVMSYQNRKVAKTISLLFYILKMEATSCMDYDRVIWNLQGCSSQYGKQMAPFTVRAWQRIGLNVPRMQSDDMPFMSYCFVETDYKSRYWLPEPVRTTVPALAPDRTGDVVISVPLRKLGELLTKPVIDPSEFCFQRDRTGILSLGGAAFLGGVGFLTGAAFTAGAAGFEATDVVPLGPPNNERVGREAVTFAAGGALTGTSGALGGVGLEPPKNEKDFGAGAGAGGGTGSTLGAGLEPNRENAGFGAGAGAAGTGATLGAGLGPKKEADAAGLGAMAGGGGGATFGAGLGLKNEKLGSSFFGGTGAGAGLASAFGDFLFPPKKEENASVTGSLVSMAGTGFKFNSGFGAGTGALFSGALNRLVKLIVARGDTLEAAFGGAALTTGAGFGAGALATGTGFGAGALATGTGFGAGFGAVTCATAGLGAGGDLGWAKKSKLSDGRGAGVGGAFATGALATGLMGASTFAAGVWGAEPKNELKLREGRGAGAGVTAFGGGGGTAAFLGAGAGVTVFGLDPKMEPNMERGAGLGAGAGSGAGGGGGASRACFTSHSRAWALRISAASSESRLCLSTRAAAAASAALAALIASAATSSRSLSRSFP